MKKITLSTVQIKGKYYFRLPDIIVDSLKLYNEDKNNSSLSDVDVYIEMMQKNNTKFNYKVVNNWYDSGNITGGKCISLRGHWRRD